MDGKPPVDRRIGMRLWIMLLASVLFVMWSGQRFDMHVASAQSTAAATSDVTRTPIPLPPPTCSAPNAVTPALTEGPFYKRHTPERTSLLEPGIKGTEIILTGYVLSLDCRPVAHAWLDFWQADGAGVYDNAGYRLRGHQFTDSAGRYYLETVLPGEYPGRTEHIHVKIQAPNKPILTTQLFFPGAAGNDRDAIFNPALIVSVLNPESGGSATPAAQSTPSAEAGPVGDARILLYTFNFVVDTR
jgi:protocatechuate 3,4-dioxygenase beta subunit